MPLFKYYVPSLEVESNRNQDCNQIQQINIFKHLQAPGLKKRNRPPNVHSLISQMVWYYVTVYTACCYMIG